MEVVALLGEKLRSSGRRLEQLRQIRDAASRFDTV
jgi:hypothetical protein